MLFNVSVYSLYVNAFNLCVDVECAGTYVFIYTYFCCLTNKQTKNNMSWDKIMEFFP